MAVIAVADFEALVDSIGMQWQDVLDHVEATTGSSIRTGTLGNITRIVGSTVPEVKVDLLRAYKNNHAILLVSGQPRLSFQQPTLNAFNRPIKSLDFHVRHRGSYDTLDAYVAAVSTRVPPEFKTIAEAVLRVTFEPETTFPPVTQLAQYDTTGVSVGTYTHTADIDDTLYADADCVLEVVTNPTGGSTATYNLTMENAAGSSSPHSVVVPAGTVVGTTFPIGVVGTDRYVSCTAISHTGGQSGDHVIVKSIRDRALSY